MTFRDRFKAHVVTLRSVGSGGIEEAFASLDEAMSDLGEAVEREGVRPEQVITPDRLDTIAKTAALFYFIGEKAEAASGEDAAP